MTKPAAPLPLQQRAELFAHLGAMEQAGVPVSQALSSLSLGAPWQAAVARLQREVKAGRSLAVAGRLSGLFSPLEVSLLQAAEQAGSPARLYQRLASQYAEQARQRKAMQSRLYLPGATLLLALLIQPLPALVGGSLSVAGYLWAVLQPLLWLALAVCAGDMGRVAPRCWRAGARVLLLPSVVLSDLYNYPPKDSYWIEKGHLPSLHPAQPLLYRTPWWSLPWQVRVQLPPVAVLVNRTLPPIAVLGVTFGEKVTRPDPSTTCPPGASSASAQ